MKKSIASVLTALVLMATAGAYASGPGEENVLLPEDVLPQLKPLLEQAMQQSPKALERNLDLVSADAEGYMARAPSLPSVGGYLTYQLQEEKRFNSGGGFDAGDRLYYNFSINQAVWHWGALEAARKISHIDQELARMNYGEAYVALAAEVRSAYLGLVLQKMAVRNTEDAARLAKENLDRQQARYSANQVTYGEIMQHQLRVDEASLAMRRAKADLEFVLSSFRSLCGNSQFAESDIPAAIGDIAQAPVVGAVVVSSAADASAVVQMAEKEVAKAKLARIGPRYGLFPKLGLMAGVSRDQNSRSLQDNNGRSYTDKYQSDVVYAGTQMNWTIFDGLSNKGLRLAALTRLRRAEQRLSTVREATARNLERDRANVGFTWDSYQLAQMRLRMAREGLAHLREEAKQGQVSQEQVDTAQSGVFYNQYMAQSALAGHLSSVVQYLSARGMDPVARSAVQLR
jgi:outer membrane protein TolC